MTEDTGKEIRPPKLEELDASRRVSDARKAKPTLLEVGDAAVAKIVRDRWRRFSKAVARREAQLKVNHLRFQGNPFVQEDPLNRHEVYIPPGNRARVPPTINKIRRAVHRYVAQITADEPIIEAIPTSSSDEARDQAEAATKVLRGEWHRMNLHARLQQVCHITAIMRSGFWVFDYDPHDGGATKAQMFFETESGERVLQWVDEAGEPVETADLAADIYEGNITVSCMTPFNVRWSGGRNVHEASEVIVATMPTLEEVYRMIPSAREAKLSDLFGETERDSERWLEDVRGESLRGITPFSLDEEESSLTGVDLEPHDSKLDERVSVLRYFRKPSDQYPKGLEVLVAGKHTCYRSTLRYGIIPVAHFKLLEDPSDPLGLGLVDLLRDPQELLDFVNGHILRYLQMLKRRWFVPIHSNVKARDLVNPTQSIIMYNPAAGEPKPEVQPEIPNSLVQWVDRFDRDFQDESGMHDTLMGKHVPGVSSGRHAEALRSGDETLLGLSRVQIKEALEVAGRIILEMVKREWSEERRVRYYDGKSYWDSAVSGLDLGNTSQVELKRGTLLMLTPAQKLETLYGYIQLGLVPPGEARKMIPITDLTGFSLSEDPHYQRARRQNRRFLDGPPPALQEEWENLQRVVEAQENAVMDLRIMAASGGDEQAIAAQLEEVDRVLAGAQASWRKALDVYGFKHEEFESSPSVAAIHAEEHMAALAGEKAESKPRWWFEHFQEHALLEAQIAAQAMQPQPGGGGGNFPPTEPPGFSVEGQPTVVTGAAPRPQ